MALCKSGSSLGILTLATAWTLSGTTARVGVGHRQLDHHVGQHHALDRLDKRDAHGATTAHDAEADLRLVGDLTAGQTQDATAAREDQDLARRADVGVLDHRDQQEKPAARPPQRRCWHRAPRRDIGQQAGRTGSTSARSWAASFPRSRIR